MIADQNFDSGFQRFCFTRSQGARRVFELRYSAAKQGALLLDDREQLLSVVCTVFPRDGGVRVWIQLDFWRRVCHESGEILRAILVAVAVIAETRSIAGIV